MMKMTYIKAAVVLGVVNLSQNRNIPVYKIAVLPMATVYMVNLKRTIFERGEFESR